MTENGGHTYRSFCKDCDWERLNTHSNPEWAKKKAESSNRAHKLVYEDHEPDLEKL